MSGPEYVTPVLVGQILFVLGVALVALLVGVRLGVRARVEPEPSEEEQLAAALGVLRRHLERKALADMQAAGAVLWTPDPDRVAQLSFHSEPGADGR